MAMINDIKIIITFLVITGHSMVKAMTRLQIMADILDHQVIKYELVANEKSIKHML